MILVTGAGGFIGRHLLARCRAEGRAVRALVRRPDRSQTAELPGVEWVTGDLTEPTTLAGIAEGVEEVFHLAGIITAPREERAAYWTPNVQGTRNLLQTFRREKGPLKKFIFCSSVGAMGPLSRLPADETAACRPRNFYEQSKYQAEEVVRQFGRESGVPAAIVRPSWVYGPGDPRTLKLFQALARRRFFLIGDGRTFIHPVQVSDVVQGLLACAARPGSSGQTYILAGREPIRLADLVERLSRMLGAPLRKPRLPLLPVQVLAQMVALAYAPFGRRPPISPRRLEFFIKDQWFSIAKAQQELDYQPRVGLEEGLQQTIAWYRRHQDLP
jgi:dihydroflavonol-4-reductase